MGLRRVIAGLGIAALLGGCASAPKEAMWAGGSAEFRAETASYGVAKSSASAFQAYGVRDPVAVLRYESLGINPKESAKFTDTEKPNALAIMPLRDHNEVFYNDEMRANLDQLREAYDLAVRVVASEQEAMAAIKELPQHSISLLLLSGHGTRRTLALGGSDDGWSVMEEQRYLDRKDRAWWRSVGMWLAPDATVLLYSCSTGEGLAKEKNLANHARRHLDRRVIAASMPTTNLIIDNLLPFEARQFSCLKHPFTGYFCQDATYIPK